MFVHGMFRMSRLKPDDIRLAIASGVTQKLSDGNSLFLHIRGGSALWTYHYREGQSMRTRSLGSAADMSPAAARRAREDFAAERRKSRIERRGLAVRQQAAPAQEPAKAAPKRQRFADTLKAFIALNAPRWKGEQEAYRYGKLATSCLAPLWVDEVTTADVEAHLKTLPLTTADKDRMRIMGVVNYAVAKNLRADGPNPARKEVIKHLIASAPKSKPHPSMKSEDVPALMRDLVADGSRDARALGFLILTASRTSEARDVDWNEINASKMLWTIPKERMKQDIEHEVPLSREALTLLGEPGKGLVFGKLADDALIDKLQELRGHGYTAHGMRATFSGDWAAKAGYPKELRDMALAHATGNATFQAYNHDKLLEQRREMMNAYAAFACGA